MSTVGIVNVDITGKITYVNKTVLQGTGYSLEELVGKNAFRLGLVSRETVGVLRRRMKEKLMGKPPGLMQIQFKRKDGEWIWLQIKGRALRKHGIPVGIQIIGEDITERKRAEEALRASEEKLRLMFESVSNGITVTDLNGVITEANERTAAIHGFSSRDEVLGKNAFELIARTDHERAMANMQKTLEKGAVRGIEYSLLKADGSGFPGELSAGVLKDACGNPVGFVAVTRDITERKRAEEALHLASEIVNNMAEGVVLTPVDNLLIVYANSRFEKMFGYGTGELIGKHVTILNSPSERSAEETAKEIIEHLERDRVWRGEVHNIKKDGTSFWCQANITTFQHPVYGQVYVNVLEDITERKQAEEALRESEEKFRALIENTTDFIWEIDANGVYTYCSPKIKELWGYTPEESIGKIPFERMIPEDRERAVELFRTMAESQSSFKSIETGSFDSDGRVVVLETSGVPFHDAEGRLCGYRGISRDITERKQAEEREKRLQEELYLSSRLAAIGELAAGVAHEINNPLTGIVGFSQRLMRKSTDEAVSRDLERIHNEAQRAAKVVQNLLTFARRHEAKKEYSDINDIVQKALELRTYELRTGNIEVALDLTPGLPQTMADFGRIQEVFLNIILNAEQVMTEAKGGGKLSIKTQEINGYIRVSFTDDGPGISAEDLDRLFNPFSPPEGKEGAPAWG